MRNIQSIGSKAKYSILFIAPQPFFQWRGTPFRVRFDVQALAEIGYHVDLLTLPFGRDLDIPGVSIIRVKNPFRIKYLPIGPSLLKVIFDIILIWNAFSLMSKIRYNFIHCIEDAGLIGVLLKSFYKCRFVYEKHSDPASYRRGWLRNIFMHLYSIADAYVTRNADVVITGSSLTKQAIKTAPFQRIHTIFSLPSSLNKTNSQRVQEIRKELKKNNDEILITYVGSFAVYQGIDLMFESIPYTLRDNPLSRFVIIGGTKKEIAKWDEWLIGKSIGDSVIFLGEIDPEQISNYLSASDILLSPRIAGKNSPIKLLDYLKAGRPIVATDIHANRILLNESVSVFTDATPQSFSEGIKRLIQDPGLRRKLSLKGKRIVEENYSYEEFKMRLDVCYSELQRE
jgi:glycosyltransferase involved in cell wall biosynthesis